MDNQDRMFNLLEKIYTELQDTKLELKDTKLELKGDITRLELKLENEVIDKIRALFDHRDIINHKLDEMDEKIDKLQIDMNNLTMKVVQSDNQMIEIKRNLKNVK